MLSNPADRTNSWGSWGLEGVASEYHEGSSRCHDRNAGMGFEAYQIVVALNNEIGLSRDSERQHGIVVEIATHPSRQWRRIDDLGYKPDFREDLF